MKKVVFIWVLIFSISSVVFAETVITDPRADAMPAFAPIISQLKHLESNRDAKCHSTACRFENFVFGTPLNDESRHVRETYQKKFTYWVWKSASQLAQKQQKKQIQKEDILESLKQFYVLEKTDQANLKVQFVKSNLPPIILSKTRHRQYSTISYSLRVVLGVQQDLVMSEDVELLALDQESVAEIEKSLNIVTLSALMLSDKTAQAKRKPIVEPEFMDTAWKQLFGDELNSIKYITEVSRVQNVEKAREILFELFREKINAYTSYNELEQINLDLLFNNNVWRYYARHPVPVENEYLMEVFKKIVREFTITILKESQAVAKNAGNVVIDSLDANKAVNKHFPHFIDDFEDVYLFYNLGRGENITLEAYDCDSFRDTSLHWSFIEYAYGHPGHNFMPADPFAIEIIAEAVSAYSVLIFRVSGEISKSRERTELSSRDIKEAKTRIVDLAKKHHEAKPLPKNPNRIISANNVTQKLGGQSRFVDVTKYSQIDFTHRSSKWLDKFRRNQLTNAPSFSGGGIASDDINKDGLPDLIFVGGSGNKLYLNEGKGKFKDVTVASGIDDDKKNKNHPEARQPIIADFNNDGHQDILITYANADHQLFKNKGNTQFEDVSKHAGLGGKDLIGGSATVFDYDNDGLLDIYISYFGHYLNGVLPTLNRDNTNALPNKLFHNEGGFVFKDVTENSGVDDLGWAQATAHTDFNRDGLQDIIVANDFGLNAFLQNNGDGTFLNVSKDLGLTKSYHSMNVGVADLNQDDFPDIYISNITTMVKDNKYVLPTEDTTMNFNSRALASMLVRESNMLYMSQVSDGKLSSYQPYDKSEYAPVSAGWAWDAEFFDYDNDGDDDLYVLNGTNDYNVFTDILPIEKADGQTDQVIIDYAREANVLYVNESGILKDVSKESGLSINANSRSAAYLDVDNDGDLDMAINNFHMPANFFLNNLTTSNWIKVKLIGDPNKKCNLDAIGARLLATNKNGLRVYRELQGGSGYLSMDPKVQHFGLGDAKQVDLEIVWPNGEIQKINSLAANKTYTIQLGQSVAKLN